MTQRLSIPTRVFLAFAISFAASVALLIASVVEHQRTSESLRLLQEGYVPLAITVGEAKATQSLFATLLDRVLNEDDPTATRHWLNTARRLRPTTVRRALYNVDRAFRLKPAASDAAALERIRGEMRAVEDTYLASDAHYDQLFAALTSGRRPEAERLLKELQNDERLVRDRLRRARDAIESRLSTFSAVAAEREERTTVWLMTLTVVALLLAIAVTWWTQRVLAPLPRIEERVLAVAKGEFVPRLDVRSNDELGKLAREFERMVEALAARDASLREAHEEQLRTRARLTQTERLAAIGRMAAHVTHEVRNPLSSIRLNVELLEEDLAGASAETKAILAAIHREIERLAGISEEYLRLARVPEPRLEQEDVVALTRSVVDFAAREMQDAHVRVELEVAGGSAEAAGAEATVDEQQIRQVLLNLLRNAREAMPGGGVIAVKVESSPTGVRISVRDHGTGVPPEKRDQIFELFFTTKERGSGLGLPLSQQIVQAHGGTLTYEDASGGGAAFHVWLPVLGGEPGSAANAAVGAANQQENA